ncbi:MAG: FtsX-like permease family protein, partial [Pseudomonadota bacterium]
DDPYGVVIGKKLSRLLDVTIGDEIVFIGQTSDGYMANELFKIRGVLKSVSSSIDSSSVFISDQSLIEMLALPEGAHEIAIMRADRNHDLQLATKQITNMASAYETLNWRQLMPVIARFLDTADVQTFIMLIFTYIAVASVVLNAMLMSVFERIHEFGIMKAIGVTPMQSIILIYAETLLLTILSSIIGLVSGLSIAIYFETHGLDMSSLAEDISFAGIAFDPIWYAHVSPQILINPIIFLFVISVLAVIYPALKIARIRAVDAIHFH